LYTGYTEINPRALRSLTDHVIHDAGFPLPVSLRLLSGGRPVALTGAGYPAAIQVCAELECRASTTHAARLSSFPIGVEFGSAALGGGRVAVVSWAYDGRAAGFRLHLRTCADGKCPAASGAVLASARPRYPED
jgi:hypothetical protein